MALAVAIPVHMHISTNAVVTDYVPKNIRREWPSAGPGTAAAALRRLRWLLTPCPQDALGSQGS